VVEALPQWGRVLWAFAKDSAGPAAIAGLYTGWAHQSTPSEPWPDLLGRWGVAYFFLMWFVGQFSRVAKRLEDRAQLTQIQQDVAAIREGLQRDGASPPQGQTPTERLDEIKEPTARALISEAWQSFEGGLLNSALLTAAVAFEHAIRSRAQRMGVDATRTPVPQLLNQLKEGLDPNVVGEMQALWRTRNTLIHMREDQPDLQLARNILQNFTWAIQLLSR
jgi:hypothetical protein